MGRGLIDYTLRNREQDFQMVTTTTNNKQQTSGYMHAASVHYTVHIMMRYD